MNRLDRLAGITPPLLLSLLLIGTLCACGKEGPPIPRDQRDMFAWGDTAADFSDDCLLFVGQLSGAHKNANLFALELEAATDGICLDCPFRPGEFLALTPVRAENGSFTFRHCPASMADVYRWRLIAKNVFQSLPQAVSPVKIVRRPF